jgi:hypothetical protein
MNSQALTDSNHSANLGGNGGSAIVRGKFYNGLRADVVVNETNITAEAAKVAALQAVVLPAGGVQISTNVVEYSTEVTLTATEIVGSAAGAIGHGNGAILVTSPGSGYVLELVSAVLIYDFLTAAYTGGGDDNVIQLGTAAQTAAIAGADLLEAAGDKIVKVGPLSAVDLPATVGTNLALKGTALTQPGTAAGVLRVNITYRIHTTNL